MMRAFEANQFVIFLLAAASSHCAMAVMAAAIRCLERRPCCIVDVQPAKCQSPPKRPVKIFLRLGLSIPITARPVLRLAPAVSSR